MDIVVLCDIGVRFLLTEPVVNLLKHNKMDNLLLTKFRHDMTRHLSGYTTTKTPSGLKITQVWSCIFVLFIIKAEDDSDEPQTTEDADKYLQNMKRKVCLTIYGTNVYKNNEDNSGEEPKKKHKIHHLLADESQKKQA